MCDRFLPKVRRFHPSNKKFANAVILAKSPLAKAKSPVPVGARFATSPDLVHKTAEAQLRRLGGSTTDNLQVLGQYTLQIGQYFGQSFKWLLENDLGYAAHLACEVKGEKLSANMSNIALHKLKLLKYVESFPGGREAVALQLQKRNANKIVPRFVPRKRKNKVTVPSLRGQPRKPQLADSTQVLSDSDLLRAVEELEKTGTIPSNRKTSGTAGTTSAFLVSPKKRKVIATPTGLDVTHVDETVLSSAPDVSVHDEPSCSKRKTQYTAVEMSYMNEIAASTAVEFTSGADDPCCSYKTTRSSEAVEFTYTEETFPSTAQDYSLTDELISFEPVLTSTQQAILSRQKQIPTLKYQDSATSRVPAAWVSSLPEADQNWVGRAMFKVGKDGKPHLDMEKATKMVWHPPQPSVSSNNPPVWNNYFATKLLLWMPRKLWGVKYQCPRCSAVMISAGIYRTVRRVLDVDGYYTVVTEYLECKTCLNYKLSAWNDELLSQLSVGQRAQFPVILTYKYACDVKVISMMRQRTLGNSATLLYKTLREIHGDNYSRRLALYLEDCNRYVMATTSGLFKQGSFKPHPSPVSPPMPQVKWILSVYRKDVLSRLDEVKASITSVFGQVLKIDSTKQIVKKLAGWSQGTAAWVTNVGNESGEILMSVVTATEGEGLSKMVDGLCRRYRGACADPPTLIYMDRDCCNSQDVFTKYGTWPDVVIRLDVWHFMRRFAHACYTSAHPLYGVFMARLSECIFAWCVEDLDLLHKAKRNQLLSKGFYNPTVQDVAKRTGKKQLLAHCRRQTRGVAQTTKLLLEMFKRFTGPHAVDDMGLPLLNKEKLKEIWKSQEKHVECIQDPKGFSLYTKTADVLIGGIAVPRYRCARGSTSLESFHLHVNRFIPGTSANAANYQAFLLDGIFRWNQDRYAATLTNKAESEPFTYSGHLRASLNVLNHLVYGELLFPSFKPPRAYTGELFGVEYLFDQTGNLASESISHICDLANDDDDIQEIVDDDEGFVGSYQEAEDETVPLIDIVVMNSPGLRQSMEARVPFALPQQSMEAQAPFALPCTHQHDTLCATEASQVSKRPKGGLEQKTLYRARLHFLLREQRVSLLLLLQIPPRLSSTALTQLTLATCRDTKKLCDSLISCFSSRTVCML